MTIVLPPALGPFGIPEHLKTKAVETLIEKRVAGRSQYDIEALSRHHDPTLDSVPKQDPCLDGIKFTQNLDGVGEIVPRLGKETGDLSQDALDLSAFSRNRRSQPVVELHHRKGFHKRRRTAGGHIQQQPVELGSG